MVASSLLNFFQTAPKQAGGSSTSSATAAYTGQPDTAASQAAGRKFASMLRDSSDNAPRVQDRQDRKASRDFKPTNDRNTTTVRASRDVKVEASFTPKQLDHTVDAAEANDILSDLDTKLPQLIGDLAQDPHTREQCKEQLVAIAEGEAPKTVEEILAATDVQVGDLAAATGTEAPDAQGVSVQAVITHTAQRVLHMFNKALSTAPEETPAQDATPDAMAASAINPALFALQASSFQADAGAAQATEETGAQTAADATATVTVITPLSQQVAVSAYSTVAAAEVEDVAEAPLAAPQAIDARVPSLTLVKDKNSLPEVELPHARLSDSTTANATAQADAAAKPVPEVVRQLEALSGTAKAFTAPEERPAEARATTVTSITSVTPLQGATGIVSPHAIAPTTGVAAVGALGRTPVSNQVFVAIKKASQEGIDQITVQLDPVDLGRIEVKLHMAKDGQTQIAFMVDKPETFDALSRDARTLEQSLQEAGIKADTSGMQFNLRQQNQQTAGQQGNSGGSSNGATGGSDAPAAKADVSAAADTSTKAYRLDLRDGVDIQA